MAKLVSSIGLILTITYCLISTTDVHAGKQGYAAEKENKFFRDICLEKEKLMTLQVYVQDLRIGNPHATVFEVAKASITDSSPFSFGSVHVLDDLVTAGPAFNSTPIGRIQGLTTNSDLSTFGIAMNLNFYFTVGKLAGSTLSILGRNQVMDNQRELPVVGGTGFFRFARGYAIQTTYSIDFETNYAVLGYTIYTTYNSNLNERHDAIEIDVL
ncbi:dirigent protein 11-like [Salvia divinorum]|uniref:Dirigent protein n=1 Tax=Salvia divinorum TaxID=28513 RepID=A0ABD1HDE2_SALDI